MAFLPTFPFSNFGIFFVKANWPSLIFFVCPVGLSSLCLTFQYWFRMATQGWLFIAPLVLIRFTPGRLLGPAVWGLATMLATALLTPPLGVWADQTDRRRVVTLGVTAQATEKPLFLETKSAVLSQSRTKWSVQFWWLKTQFDWSVEVLR